jgi:hypothetical protein
MFILTLLLSFLLAINTQNSTNITIITAPTNITATTNTTVINNIPFTITELTNIIYESTFLKYLDQQVTDCFTKEKPKGYSDCGNLITDAYAKCCFINKPDKIKTCFPVPSDYPALFNDTFTKLGVLVDCPLLNNYSKKYNNTPINIDDQGEFLSGSHKCKELNNPFAETSCPKDIGRAISSCCNKYKNKTISVVKCMNISDTDEMMYSGMLAYLKAQVDCNSSRDIFFE